MNLEAFLKKIDRALVIDWLGALGVAVISFVVLMALRHFIQLKHRRMAATQRVEFMELPLQVLSTTRILFFLVLSAYAGLQTLELSKRLHDILISVVTIALFWQAGVWATATVSVWLMRKRASGQGDDLAAVSSLGVVGFVVQAIIWTVVVLLTLENLGVRVTALVAGLGIGGVAVALAVQNVLGDLLASLAITFDRPFVIGDFLSVGDVLGSVEYIGVKTTRLRSLDGEQVILSNAEILRSRIRNYRYLRERRVQFNFAVAHGTPVELVEKLPTLVRGLVEAQSPIRIDRCHFQKYSIAGLEFELVYYVLSAEYNAYMDIQQAINIAMLKKFNELGVLFAQTTPSPYLAAKPQTASVDEKNNNNL